MDRRSFTAMLGSIPFVSLFAMESLPEKEIEKIQPLDEATLLVIRKAQALTDGFLTGFKNVKFELLTNNGKIPMTVKNYTISNGVARIELNSIALENGYLSEVPTVIATYDNNFIAAYALRPTGFLCIDACDTLNSHSIAIEKLIFLVE